MNRPSDEVESPLRQPAKNGDHFWRALFAVAMFVWSSLTVGKEIVQGGADNQTPHGECMPSGTGRDYQVGSRAGQLGALELVPWERLGAGDTVRIFFRPDPYRGKIYIAAQGRPDAPVRVCGVKGQKGEKPVIEGRDAVTRRGMNYGHPLHESRSIILINRLPSQDWKAFPSHVQIDGLAIRGAHPSNQFIDATGAQHRYSDFGACIWVERGHFVSIADNEITNCTQAIFSKSTDDGDFALTRDIRIVLNNMYNNGLVGSDHLHTTYIQSVGVIYEFNRYGILRPGARGSSIKDRSVDTVIRYNRIEDGARALDLVEAEDYPVAAKADPRYRETYVYGNQISKDGSKGSAVHYGGDHNGSTPGANWGEPNNRKGTLYFFHNTVHLKGTGYGVMFQLSTTEEHAQIWNNIFIFDATIPSPRFRSGTEVGASWMSGGTISLGANWISEPWTDSVPRLNWRGRLVSLACEVVKFGRCASPSQLQMGAPLIGAENMISGINSPINLSTMRPLSRDIGLERHSIFRGAVVPEKYSVDWQLGMDGTPKRRAQNSGRVVLGAVDH